MGRWPISTSIFETPTNKASATYSLLFSSKSPLPRALVAIFYQVFIRVTTSGRASLAIAVWQIA